MKKFKFNIRLTASLVSFFVGIVLAILGAKNKYCLGAGFIFIGLGSFLYSWHRSLESVDLQTEVNEELMKYDPEIQENTAIINELGRIQDENKKKTKRTNIVFVLFGAMMVIVGFIACI